MTVQSDVPDQSEKSVVYVVAAATGDGGGLGDEAVGPGLGTGSRLADGVAGEDVDPADGSSDGIGLAGAPDPFATKRIPKIARMPATTRAATTCSVIDRADRLRSQARRVAR